jgi:hypothetical protein
MNNYLIKIIIVLKNYTFMNNKEKNNLVTQTLF